MSEITKSNTAKNTTAPHQAKLIIIEKDSEAINNNINKDSWTPLLGAQVLCGIKPLSEDEFNVAHTMWNYPEISEAKRILTLWGKQHPEVKEIPPGDFIAWSKKQKLNIDWLNSPIRDEYLPPYNTLGNSLAEAFASWTDPPRVFPTDQTNIEKKSNTGQPKKKKNAYQGKFFWIYQHIDNNIITNHKTECWQDIWRILISQTKNGEYPQLLKEYDHENGIKCIISDGTEAYLNKDNIRNRYKNNTQN